MDNDSIRLPDDDHDDNDGCGGGGGGGTTGPQVRPIR